MELTLGEETITTFRQALERVAALAHARLQPELHGHLERAVALVKNRHVWMDEDGKHAQVLSSDGQTWYICNGHCTCMDATRAPEGWCKHRLSVALYRRASELLAQQGAVPVAPTPAAPGSGPGQWLPEAPASVNVRVMIDGRECQVTLRDTDEARLLTRVQAVLARYPAPVCAKAPQIVAPDGGAPDGWCAVHNVQMQRQSNARGSWFSHRAPDGGWCRGKAPRA